MNIRFIVMSLKQTLLLSRRIPVQPLQALVPALNETGVFLCLDTLHLMPVGQHLPCGMVFLLSYLGGPAASSCCCRVQHTMHRSERTCRRFPPSSSFRRSSSCCSAAAETYWPAMTVPSREDARASNASGTSSSRNGLRQRRHCGLGRMRLMLLRWVLRLASDLDGHHTSDSTAILIQQVMHTRNFTALKCTAA